MHYINISIMIIFNLYLLLRACLLIVKNCEGETEPLFPHYILRSNQRESWAFVILYKPFLIILNRLSL